MPDSLCIATLDPQATGGTREVTRITVKAAKEAGLEPSLVYNAVPWDDCVTITSLLRGDFTPDVYEEEIWGAKGIRIGRRFPEVESLNYIANLPQWRDVIDQYDEFIGVGGTPMQCLPLSLTGKQYSCWLGTTLRSERVLQQKDYPLLKRTRYSLEKPILFRIEKNVLSSASNIFAQSKYTRRRISEEYGIPKSEIEILPVPIDTEKYRPSDSGSGSHEIVTVGRINAHRKNIGLLLRAFSIVQDTIPEASLRLIGDDLSDENGELLRRLGIAEDVSVEGYVEELVPRLQNAALYATSSLQEGLGISVLEAMSCGLPVVSTKCGGPEDYIRHGENGFLAKQEPIDLADYMVETLQNKQLHSRMSSQARQTVLSDYNEDEILPELINAIQK